VIGKSGVAQTEGFESAAGRHARDAAVATNHSMRYGTRTTRSVQAVERLIMRAVALLVFLAVPVFVAGQASPSRVLVGSLAKPGALEFEGGGCERTGDTMECTFQQVLLTHKPPSDTCEIVTNRYQLSFVKQDARRWVSNEGPNGPCGIVAITTIEEDPKGSGTIWTMNSRKVVMNRNADESCKLVEGEPPDDLTGNDTKRPLPCKFIVPALLQ
jgi:hypothetical protein